MMALVTGTPLPRDVRHALRLVEGGDRDRRRAGRATCSNQLVEIRDNEVVFEQQTSGGTAPVRTVLQLNENRVSADLATERRFWFLMTQRRNDLAPSTCERTHGVPDVAPIRALSVALVLAFASSACGRKR